MEEKMYLKNKETGSINFAIFLSDQKSNYFPKRPENRAQEVHARATLRIRCLTLITQLKNGKKGDS